MMSIRTALNIVSKRLISAEDSLLNLMEKEELKFNRQLSKKFKLNNIGLDPIKKRKVTFPQDVLPKENIPLEWWYFTGHLEETKNKGKRKKQRFGYEFCIFKFHPSVLRIGPFPFSKIRTEPFLVFHFALTDKNSGEFYTYQDTGLKHPQKINYDKLQLGLEKTNLSFNKSFNLKSNNDLVHLNLKLIPLKKIVKHFEEGYSVMVKNPEQRTYYLTFSRLKTNGTLNFGSQKYNLSGLSWFDHQKMNLPHHSPLKGWDWFSIILDDKTELMLFVLKNKRGVVHQMGGTYIDQDSNAINLSIKDFKINPLGSWKSDKTKIIYPSEWEINIPKLDLSLRVIPAVKDQELERVMATPLAYWEGACDVQGSKGKKKITGLSYVELVGYDQRFWTKFLQKSFR